MSHELNFTKLHSCGNSFVLVGPEVSAARFEKLSQKILDPNVGVGADGLIVVGESSDPPFTVMIYNRDGSPGGMSGNGVLCVARYLLLKRLVNEDCKAVDLDVHGRRISCSYQSSCVVLDMGEPSFEPNDVPVRRNTPLVSSPLRVGGKEYLVTALSMGNPHCVVFVSNLNDVSSDELGPLFEMHEMFPNRTNVEFVQRISPNRLKIRRWERGVGRTLACGSGACAAVVAGVRQGICDSETEAEFEGGSLKVRYETELNRVYLKGSAEEICEGRLLHDFLTNG